uniref:Transmembrane protein 216 n=1 Tax=Latimeria chalumnae TaxID=7897 RepID=H3AHC7_LATCH
FVMLHIDFVAASFFFHLLCAAGSKGNLSQRKVTLSISLGLTIPAAMMAVYYLLLQTYVLRVEVILNAILLVFYALEFILDIVALTAFASIDSV